MEDSLNERQDVANTVSFTVEGKPRGKGSVRSGMGRHFIDAKTRAAMRAIQFRAKEAMDGAKPFELPIMLMIEATFAFPKSWSKRKRKEAMTVNYEMHTTLMSKLADARLVQHTTKPDADNIAKLVKDSLSGILYVDDKQVSILHVSKKYDIEDRIIIWASEI
jgi:Holliday junction resolvase RusA-like endonuclease